MLAPTFDPFTRFTRAVNRVFIRIASVIAAFMLLVIVYDLILRNVFDDPTIWALDVSRFALIFLFFFALAPALESGAHVAVDMLEHYLPARAKRRLKIVALALVLVFGGFLLWQVTKTTIEAFRDDHMFPTMIPVKQKHIYWIGPIGIIEFLLTAIALIIQAARRTMPTAHATH